MPDNLPLLSRPKQGAVLGGVCAGLARRYRLDPNVLRILAVVLAVVFSGIGVTLYIAGMLIIPRDGAALSPLQKGLPFTRTWPPAALVAVMVVIAASLAWGSGGGFGLAPAAAAIFAVWYFWLRKSTRSRPPRQVEPTPFERAAQAWRLRLAEQNVPGFETAAMPASAPADAAPRWQQPYTDPADQQVSDSDPHPAPVRRRRGWRLWWLALALSGAATTTVALLGRAGFPAGPVAYPAAVLAALGVTLLVAARRGRPPLLILAAVLTALAMIGQAVPTISHFGDLTRSYTEASQLPRTVKFTAGSVDLDLSDLELTEDQSLDVEIGAGDVRLTLPATAASDVSWRVRFGQTDIAGATAEGNDLSGNMSFAARGSQGTLRLQVHVTAGELVVSR